ncbi:MAG: DUF2344 domain-containing protein [Firmicutes bacterium]|nr:DUF2344 domain-containing protein [Bacillota bacterium]
MRIRLLFKKGEPVRFISHLDTMRAFARAMRRAGLPVAFSRGFNPHPRMVFALPLAVGATSEMDVLDVDFSERVGLLQAVQALNAALPPGLCTCVAREIPVDSPPAMSVVDASEYSVKVPIKNRSVDPAGPLRSFMESGSICVERKREGQPARTIDVRPLVLIAAEGGDGGGGMAHYEFTIRSGSRQNLRPDELLQALDSIGEGWLELAEARYHRRGLYTLRDGRLVPLV